jgi:acyl carrier protein
VDELIDSVEQEIVSLYAKYMRLDPTTIDARASLESMSIDSIIAVTIISDLEKKFEISLSPIVFWQSEDLHAVALHIVDLVDRSNI